MERKGLIHIYTGDGKGKTTASLGLAVRAAGSGMKVRMLQFLKSYGSSEHNVKIDNLTVETVEEKVKFVFNMTDEEKEENRLRNERRFKEVVEECKNDGTGLLVLDGTGKTSCSLVKIRNTAEHYAKVYEHKHAVDYVSVVYGCAHLLC